MALIAIDGLDRPSYKTLGRFEKGEKQPTSLGKVPKGGGEVRLKMISKLALIKNR